MNERFSFQKGTIRKLHDLQFGKFQGFTVHRINLGQDYKTVLHLKKGKDIKMLSGLRHYAIIGRYQQDSDVNSLQPPDCIL